jgi:uncharacterized membrane protein
VSEQGDGKLAVATPPPPDSVAPGADTPVVLASPVPPGSLSRSERSISSLQVRASFGFMTDPQSLAEYERNCPGSADLIIRESFAQANREQAHRQKQETEALAAEIDDNRKMVMQGTRAQWIGGALTALVIGLAYYLAHLAQYAAATTVVGLGCSGALVTFIYGRKKQAEEVKATQAVPAAHGGAISATSVAEEQQDEQG